jgi:hypothetical protein
VATWKCKSSYWIKVDARSASQAIPLLRSLNDDELVGLASTAALVNAAKAAHISDSEEELRDRLLNERASSSDESLVLLATVQWQCREFEASLLTIDQLDGVDADESTARAAKALSGWILLSQAGVVGETGCERDADSDDDVQDSAISIADAQRLFEGVLIEDPSNIDVRIR